MMSCSSKIDRGQGFGHWYTCTDAGLYIELLTTKDSLIYITNENFSSQWNAYKIIGDTLIEYDSHIFKDSIFITKALMEKSNSKKLVLDYVSSPEHWEFKKLSQDVNANLDVNKLSKEVKQRASLNQCTDKRSPAEIQKDSLKFIDFQF